MWEKCWTFYTLLVEIEICSDTWTNILAALQMTRQRGNTWSESLLLIYDQENGKYVLRKPAPEHLPQHDL